MPIHIFNRRHWLQAAASGCCAAMLPRSFAQTQWPARPITLIAPNAPGGPADTLARAVSAAMTKDLGVAVVVDNKPGAAGKIGTQALLRAPRDGYTIAITTVTTLSALPVFDPAVGYKSPDDFISLNLAVRSPGVWCVHPSLGIKTLPQLVAYAKAHPGKLNYASFGTNSSSHLAQEDFFRRLDIQLTHVPYKGESEGVTALLANQVQVMLVGGNAKAYVTSGKLVGLATTSEKPWDALPDIVTANRAGLPQLMDYSYEPWLGIAAAANTPDVVVQRLRTALRNAMLAPETKSALTPLGYRIVAGDAREMHAAIEQDMALYRVLLRSGRVRVS